MLVSDASLVDFPILSLHVGSEIARVAKLIVDPNNLKILGFELYGPLVEESGNNILPIDSVREFSRFGMIVDSIDDFATEDDIIRIRDVLNLNFSLIDLRVVTKKGAKLGRISSFTVSVANWEVFQIIVQRPLMKSFFDPELTISADEIIEIDNHKVTVRDEYDRNEEKESIKNPDHFTPNFVNPFREPDFTHQSESESSS